MSRRVGLLSPALRDVNADLRRVLSDVGGARSPELVGAAKVLRGSIRKTLSTRGGGQPAPPGSPPHRQSGRLAKSVKAGVVGTGQRVGVLAFYGSYQETGVNAKQGTAKVRVGRRGKIAAGKVKRTLSIPARPFMQRAYDAVKDQMTDGIVVSMGERVEQL